MSKEKAKPKKKIPPTQIVDKEAIPSSSSGYQVGDQVDSDALFKQWAESQPPEDEWEEPIKKRPSLANHPMPLMLIILLSAYLFYGSYPAFEAVMHRDQYEDCGDITLRPDQREKNPQELIAFRHKQKCQLKGIAQGLNLYEVGKAENPKSTDPFEVKKGLSYVVKLVGDRIFAIVPAHEQWVEGYKIKTESLLGLEINGRGIIVSPKLDKSYRKLGEQLRMSFHIPEEEEIFFFDMGYDPWANRLALFTFFFSPIVMIIAFIALRKLWQIKKLENQSFPLGKSSQSTMLFVSFSILLSMVFFEPQHAWAQEQLDQVNASPKKKLDLQKIAKLKLNNPLIWAFYHPDQPQKKSYLIGTIHIPHPGFMPLPKRFTEAIDQSNGFYGELDLSDKQSLAIKMMGAAMMSDGNTLSALLTAKAKQVLDQQLSQHGVPASFFESMHPSFVELMLMALELKELMQQGLALDEQLFQYAKNQGKKTGGIETVEEQINALLIKDVKQAAIALTFTLDKVEEEGKKGTNTIEELMKVYFEGVESKIDEFNQKELKNAPKAQVQKLKALLDDRNKVMVKRITELLNKNKNESYTFAFGAAHFVSGGEQSILSLLKKQGYLIQRLK